MPVNVNQYREAVGVFYGCSFVTTKEPFYVTETNCVRKISVPFSAINMVVLFFPFFFMVTVSFYQKYRKTRFKSIILPILVTVFCLTTLGYIFG